MALFRFYGRILPPSPIIRLTMRDLPSIHWEDEELGLVLDATLAFVDSEVHISCESNLYTTAEQIGEVYKTSLRHGKGRRRLLFLHPGTGLSVILERVIPPSGIQHNILVERPELAKLVTAFDLDPQNKGSNFYYNVSDHA